MAKKAKSSGKVQAVQTSNLAAVPMDKEGMIKLRNSGIARRSNALATNNLKGTKIGFLGLHYSRNDRSVFLESASSEVIAEALQDSGHITVTSQPDNTYTFQTYTDGELTPDRRLPTAAEATSIVSAYCDKEGINPDGSEM